MATTWTQIGTGNEALVVLPFDAGAVYADSYSSLNAAVAAIGSSVRTLVVHKNKGLTADLVIPATTHLVVHFNSLIVSNGHTLAINGPFSAGLYQVFSGMSAGDVTGLKDARPEWWGAVPGSMDSWFYALQVGGTKGTLSSGIYYTDGLSTNLALNPWSVNIEGVSATGSQIILINGANTDVLSVNKGQTNPLIWPTSWRIRDLLLTGNVANNTAGNGFYGKQINEFALENVTISDVAEYLLKVEDSIGLTINGPNIWYSYNATTLGGLYFKNSSNIRVNGIAVQGLAKTTAWPLDIIHDAAGSVHTYDLNQFYTEGNYNAIRVNSGAAGVSVVLNNPEIIGLPSAGGVAFDITGAAAHVTVNGGSVYGDWAKRLVTSADVVNVVFNDVHGISDAAILQQDKGGVTRIQPGAIRDNLIPNGNFELFRADFNVPMGPFGFGISGTYGKDITDFKLGVAGYKITAGASIDYIGYTLTPAEFARVKGRYLHSSIWAKGTTASAADITIFSLGGSAPSAVSDSNYDTDWHRLHTAMLIPSDATGVEIRARVYAGKIATFDGWSASINYDGPYQPKPITSTNGFLSATTAALPAAATAMDGTILIEDNGTGDRNLITYQGGQRFRIDGGAAF